MGAAAAGGRDGGDNAATAADAGGIADVAGARGVTAGLVAGSDGRVLAGLPGQTARRTAAWRERRRRTGRGVRVTRCRFRGGGRHTPVSGCGVGEVVATGADAGGLATGSAVTGRELPLVHARHDEHEQGYGGQT